MVSVSASVNLALHQPEVLLAPAHPGGPGKMGRKTVVVWWWCGTPAGISEVSIHVSSMIVVP